MSLAGPNPIEYPESGESAWIASEHGSGVLRAAGIANISFAILTRGTRDPRLIAAYQCWRSVWYDTFVELENIKRLPSDDFTRQDEIQALFCGEICIGLTACRFVDLTTEMARDDSYFNPWPSDSLGAVTTRGPMVCIGNNMTVSAEWRGRVNGISVKRLLMVLSIQRFLLSSADVLVGTMRNDRGMNKLVYELGFVPIVRGATAHGVEVDLAAYFRGEVDEGRSERGSETDEQRLALELLSRCDAIPGA